MKVQKIRIENILGLETLEFEPGRVTIVSGRNGVGKSSVLESLKYALTGGSDATIKRKGADKGEVVIVLDEATVTRDTEKAAVVSVTGVGPIRRPAEFLKSRIDSLSFNPVQFLLAPKDKRTEWFLEMVPVEVGDDELRAAGVETLPPPARNGLDRIAAATKLVYDARTGVNRALKEKRAAVAQLAEGLSEVADVDLAALRAEKDRLSTALAADLSGVKDRAAGLLAKLREDAQARIDEIKATLATEERLVQEELVRETDRLRGIAQPEIEQAAAALAVAESQAKAAAQMEKTRELIARMTTEAAALEEESARRSATLDNLDALKRRALDRLPIQGVEIADGEILVNGIPFDRVNTAARVQFVLNVAMLRKGTLPLVLLDGLECLDPETFEAFVNAASHLDAQFICTRVTEGPLEVRVAA
ncbi:MAG TPA: AAA family ATPase [Thermoanaerobaculia bacterium]|nr:AAA family ATPase [Thermoanaerobaculia bacterium]HQN09899.1 AAA family ATPase [Thermoanaerobaculia bacterium]HQP89058.1 AAA family ATPase [Thermoanaerobaculia bacterium]